MKNYKMYLLVLIALIIIVLLFFFFKNKNDKTEEIKINMTNTQDLNLKDNSAIKDSGEYVFNKELSQMEWQGKKTFIKGWIDSGLISISSGNFTVEDGSISSGEIEIDMTSISAMKTGSNNGESMLTNHLKTADFFDVENFPISKFVIKDINKVDDFNYLLTGDLTIKDVTKSVESKIIAYEKDGKIYIDGGITIDRSLFGIKFGSSSFFENLGDKTIDNEFQIKLNLVGEESEI